LFDSFYKLFTHFIPRVAPAEYLPARKFDLLESGLANLPGWNLARFG
jgi:hypothetical protein